ncbi:hypothetical protein Dimus_009964 [Dionaea muscipula]
MINQPGREGTKGIIVDVISPPCGQIHHRNNHLRRHHIASAPSAKVPDPSKLLGLERMDSANADMVSIGRIKGFCDADLPDWFLSEILLHLPVKCLFRFKCVSKRWQQLISEPSFGCSYNRRNHESSTYSLPWTFLFFCTTRSLYAAFHLCNLGHHNNLLSSVLEFVEGKHRAPRSGRVLACNSGLLLCHAAQCGKDLYYVCNPLTRQSVSLPRHPQLHKWVSIGFVVGQEEDCRFHVVRIAEFSGSSNVLDLEIFSSSVGKWVERKLLCVSPVMLSIRQREAVPYKGILHWREYNNKIIAYDPNKNTDQCRLLDMPKDRDRDAEGVLGVSGESLRYLEVRRRVHDRGMISVWMVKDYQLGEWDLEYRTSVDYSPITRALLSNRGFLLRPLAFHPVEPDMVYLAFNDSIVVLHNLATKSLEPVEFDSRGECYRLAYLDLSTIFPFVLQPWPTPVHKWEV